MYEQKKLPNNKIQGKIGGLIRDILSHLTEFERDQNIISEDLRKQKLALDRLHNLIMVDLPGKLKSEEKYLKDLKDKEAFFKNLPKKIVMAEHIEQARNQMWNFVKSAARIKTIARLSEAEKRAIVEFSTYFETHIKTAYLHAEAGLEKLHLTDLKNVEEIKKINELKAELVPEIQALLRDFKDNGNTGALVKVDLKNHLVRAEGALRKLKAAANALRINLEKSQRHARELTNLLTHLYKEFDVLEAEAKKGEKILEYMASA